jgi:asparagine synthetase B (glutamine-hydrolysing)
VEIHDESSFARTPLNDIPTLLIKKWRDDRVAGNYSREVRHPFLDGELVNYIAAMRFGVL